MTCLLYPKFVVAIDSKSTDWSSFFRSVDFSWFKTLFNILDPKEEITISKSYSDYEFSAKS